MPSPCPQNGQPPIRPLSKQLLLQSTYDVEQIIRGDMVRAIALAVDAAAIEGGATGMPTGILMTSGIGEVKCDAASGGAAIVAEDIIDLEKEIAVDNADMGSLAFLTNCPKNRSGSSRLRPPHLRPMLP